MAREREKRAREAAAEEQVRVQAEVEALRKQIAAEGVALAAEEQRRHALAEEVSTQRRLREQLERLQERHSALQSREEEARQKMLEEEERERKERERDEVRRRAAAGKQESESWWLQYTRAEQNFADRQRWWSRSMMRPTNWLPWNWGRREDPPELKPLTA